MTPPSHADPAAPFDLGVSRSLLLGHDRWARHAEIQRLVALRPVPAEAVGLLIALLTTPRADPVGSDLALVWQAGQVDAARALCGIVPTFPTALPALLGRVAAADTTAAVVLDGLATQCDAGWSPPAGVADVCAAALRVPDRPRVQGWGGEGPLRPLWWGAVRLLAGCPEVARHRDALRALLAVPEVAFEPDPKARDRVVSAVGGVAAPLAAERVARLSRAGLPLDACIAPVEAWLAGEADARLAMVPALGTLRTAGWADATTWLELLACDRSPRVRAAARAITPPA